MEKKTQTLDEDRDIKEKESEHRWRKAGAFGFNSCGQILSRWERIEKVW